MTKKLIEIEPFKLTYTVENCYTGEKFEDLADIGIALGYAEKLMKLADWKHERGYMMRGSPVLFNGSIYHLFNDRRSKHPHGWVNYEVLGTRWKYSRFSLKDGIRPLVVYDNLGNIIDPSVLVGYKAKKPSYKGRKYDHSQRYYQRNLTDKATCKRKGDNRKIKTNWATTEYVDRDGEVQYNYGTSHFRNVNTKNEMTQNLAHENEYGQEFIRGRRRGRNLPNSWDDVPSSYWDCRRSWKHHSKRKHQWVPKT